MGRLAGKTALVTAAGQGIGRASAEAFLREGARVIATDIRADVLADFEGAETLVLDVTDADAVKAAAAAHPDIDVLFNCAGFVHPGTILDCDEEAWAFSNALNVTAQYRMIRAVLPQMIALGRGSIINMSSVAALGAMPMFCAYSASKGAVAAMTRSIALHCKQQGYRIRCNSVHPDGVNTPMTQALAGGQAVPQAVLDQDPMNRMCAPRDIANMVLFLASDESRFVNGAELRVDNAQLISGI